jgi:acetyl-CoA carboxylase biotin carboxylase subunit
MPGKINNILFPGGNGVRIDTHIFPGYEVPPYYDSMLAKLIVHAPTRKEAIKKMRVALEQFVIEGIPTNIEYQYLIMHNTSFIKGQYDTGFITRFNTLVEDNKSE